MSNKNAPVLLAMVLCDTIIREMGTNKLSLIGTFNGLFAQRFPCTHPSLSVYVVLTNGRGRVSCLLRMTSLEDGQEVFSYPGEVDFSDPLSVIELDFKIQQLRLEKEGEYSIELIADGEFLGSRKLRVQSVPPTEEEEE